MLKVAKDYSDEVNIVFNAGKTQLILFAKLMHPGILDLLLEKLSVICCNLNAIHLI